MLSIGFLFEDEKDDIDLEQHFEDRTNYHISLVNKYLDKIISLKLDPRSVMTMTDEARSEWLHSIPKETRNRDFRRISITYRTVPK